MRNKSTVKAVSLVMVITIFSRLISVVANQVYTTFFGVTLELNIYAYVTAFPNYIFSSIGTTLLTVVIPLFAGSMANGKKDRAFHFLYNITTIAVLFAALISALGVIFAPFIIRYRRASP